MMKAFSMFSGIGGFELGIQMASKEVEVIGYSEIDKYAIQVYEKHFPGVKNYGDATTIRGDELPDFDLLVAGFPCQAFSYAGFGRGLDDSRGTLFFDIARICSEKRPRHLVLENVKGLLSHDKGKTFQTILRVLSDLGYGVEWQVLNSKDFGVPQNRERVFIVGCLGGGSGRKIFPLTGESESSTRKYIDYEVHPVLTPDREKKRQNGRRFKDDGEPSFTLTGQDIHGVMLKEITKGKSQGERIYDPSGLATTLASQAGGLGAKTGLYKVGNVNPSKKGQSGNVYSEEGIFPTLSAGGNNPSRERDVGYSSGSVLVDTKIRRLIPLECERLQGFPDNWTEGLSDTQRYKTLGNAVTVNVVKTIMNNIAKIHNIR